MRQAGSHVLLWKDGLARPVVIARHNKEVSPATIRKIVAQAQITEEEFLSNL